MKYIHDSELVYVKAKPRNVLIYASSSSSSWAIVKWADFGLNDRHSYLLNASARTEDSDNIYWLDPDLFRDVTVNLQLRMRGINDKIVKNAGAEVDIYSEALVFLFVLLDGAYTADELLTSWKISNTDFTVELISSSKRNKCIFTQLL